MPFPIIPDTEVVIADLDQFIRHHAPRHLVTVWQVYQAYHNDMERTISEIERRSHQETAR